MGITYSFTAWRGSYFKGSEKLVGRSGRTDKLCKSVPVGEVPVSIGIYRKIYCSCRHHEKYRKPYHGYDG